MRPLQLGLVLTLVLGCGGAEDSPSSNANANSNAGGSDAEAYAIVLHRPRHAGDSFTATYRAESHTRNLLTVNGEATQDDRVHLAIELVADVTIEAVNAAGKVTSSQYTVRSCTTGGESPEPLLPAGSVLTVTAAESSEDGSIVLQGGQLTEDQLARLDLVINTHVSTRNDDDVFGSQEPRTVGSTWPIHGEVAAADLSRAATLSITPEQISGSSTFVGLETIDGVPCQGVEAGMTAEGFTVGGLPAGSVTQGATLEMRMVGAFPLDTARQRLRSGQEMAMRLVVQLPAPEGTVALMTVANLRASTTQIHPPSE